MRWLYGISSTAIALAILIAAYFSNLNALDPAYGQAAQPVIPLVAGAPVSSANPLPVNASVTANTAYTAASSLPTISAGAGAAAYESLAGAPYAQPVFGSASGGGTQVDATHGLPVLGLAGSNVIGKVGIDQTTDGTTNRTVPPYTRTKLVTTSFTPGTSYAQGNDMGGKFTFSTGLAASTPIQVRRISLVGSAATLTASSQGEVYLVGSSPATAFTDGSSPTWSSADNSLAPIPAVQTNQNASAGLIANTYISNNTGGNIPPTIVTDGSGNFYGWLLVGGTWTMTTPAAFTVTVEIGY